MKAMLLALLLPCPPCAAGQTIVDIGDGRRVVILPNGAYVPIRWIDEATDSVGQWRMGSDREKLARMAVVSMARENTALREQNDEYQEMHERDSVALNDVHQMASETVDELNTTVQKEQERNRRLRPWATVGKVAAATAAVMLVLVTMKTVAP